MRRAGIAIAVIAAGFGWIAAALAGELPLPARYVEPPSLLPQVEAGLLPPVEERLPDHPQVARMPWPGQTLGRHGGEIDILMSSQRDVRMLTVYGYARLVVYNEKLEFEADLLESFEVTEERIFTFRLRPGHKWSDGAPFTTEDFRYFWEDVANHEDLSPTGPPNMMLVDGEPPRVEIIDELTIRYSWSKPNPGFLPMLAGPSPLYIFRPSAYLKQFHADYTEPEELKQRVKAAGQRDWAALHNRRDNMYRNDNPELPTLEPWMLVTKPPSERFVFVRNPYYHRIDADGRQLPYADKVVMQVTDGKLVPAKTGAGEADLQARYLRFDNYTFLKEGEETGGYRVLLWNSATGSQMALYPNLNVNDPVWRALLRDVRFRRALSLAVNRHEINQVIYYGLADEQGNSVLKQSPLYDESYAKAWTEFDPDQANRLLDEIGLVQRDDEGIRLLPDGRPLVIVVESAGENTEEVDVLELIGDSWRGIGVKLFAKPSQREVFRNRIFSGETIMSVWTGLENGLPTADMSPYELAPTTQQQLMWPKWGQYLETGGESGEEIDMPAAKRLAALLEDWTYAESRDAREEVWREMLWIFADQVFTIGTVANVPQPVVVANELRNVPEKAMYGWDPGAHFGIYKPDCFWFESEDARDVAKQ
ncbi:MAG: peptide ABC transporter substrate-binding protein [Alphaproteobacteria bacterium]|nr:MAG: peptide ABC transporter substrate-binding protein [Alphaproteobacteria bacterium]